jgi:dihydrofolate synthase/folylpolyglutamate synthase
MNYQQVLEFMFNSLPMYQRVGQAAYKSNLDNTISLDEHFAHPHHNFKTIHVAGTNGKGSVSHSLASILQAAGYKTGLYTSPHLIDYRERIRVNGDMITEDFVCDFINNNHGILDELKPSFFEMSVALAFEYFKFSKVDIAVIEVGMGGRLDSTNIIIPELSVITNIGLDHTQFLGHTFEKIAIEKAGIIKEGIPVVIGETQAETLQVFLNIANFNNAPILFADLGISAILQKMTDDIGHYLVKTDKGNYDLNFDLIGDYQTKNLATILKSIEVLQEKGFKINFEDIKSGLSKVKSSTGLHGRWEILQTEPLTICDTGHNKEGLSYVIKQLSQIKYNKLHIILGFVNDKNVAEVLKMFPKPSNTNVVYYFTQASIPRAMAAEQVFQEAQKHSLGGYYFEKIDLAYSFVKINCSINDAIFIGGSTFIVGEFLEKCWNTST